MLLPDDDGGAGKVIFQGQGGSVSLDQVHAAVAMDGSLARFEVSADRLQQDAGAALQARPKAPRSFQLYFDAGESRINKASEALLSQIVEELKSRAAPDISVIGHTDTMGNAALNEKLSLQRAQEVAQQLRALAPRTVHLDITSHGERNLLIPTPDNTDEPRNRRVEITVR
jgi:peptidoglycan-associated lipoprotein